MTIHEFGDRSGRTVVLIHPSLVMWDYFEYVIPLLEQDFHVVVPALPGYDPDGQGDFTSIEEIAAELEDRLLQTGCGEVACMYGCSMGGSVAVRMLADRRLNIRSAVIDGGITPYQLPRLLTRCIAVRDFLMICMGKLGGLRLLEKAFAADDYSEDDLQYLAKVLRSLSARTIWRTFDSCNNYTMPEPVQVDCPAVEYWFTDAEEQARRWDISYIQKQIPQTRFRRIRNLGHGGMAPLRLEQFARAIRKLAAKSAE